jgi:hypothetical protein
MRADLAFALRRGAARLLVGLAAVALAWAGLYKVWPWTHPSMKPEVQIPLPAPSPWNLPLAAAVFVLALALAVLIYRRRPTSR